MELDSLVVADGVGDLERQTKSLKSLMGLGVGGSWVWFGLVSKGIWVYPFCIL